MNINIVGSATGGNKGSSAKLVNYLEKENKGKKTAEKGWFFSHEKDKVSVQSVIDQLDNNKKKLKHKEAKFYMLNISPSQKELAHIGNDPEKLKAYTRKVMDEYARNFNRGIEGKDLLYFAKIEHERRYKGNDPAVKAGTAKQGDLKPGLQTHIHVIVSRKDRYNERQFSPLTNHKGPQSGAVSGGFNRSVFFQKAEQAFDRITGYKRELEESYMYRNAMKNGNAKEQFEMKQVAKGKPQVPSLLRGLVHAGSFQEAMAPDPEIERRRRKSEKSL